MVRKYSAQKCATRAKNTNIFCLCDVDLRPLTFVFDDEKGNKLNVTLGNDDLLTEIGTTDQKQAICRIDVLRGALFTSGPVWTLGDVFLRRSYVVLDGQGLTVSIFPIPANASAQRVEAPSRGVEAPSKAFPSP